MARGLVPREVTVAEARGFVVQAGGLAAPWASVGEAIRHLGYVQMDPIDVCGKMHDLILRNRVAGYRRDGLLETLYAAGEREFFEHYIPGRGVLVALPVTEYRYLSRAMRARRTRDGYGGTLDADQRRMARVILRRIRDEGPLGTGAFTNDARSETGWGTMGTLARTTLDKLFLHGRLMVARRENFRRIFDLTERVLPREILAARAATPREEARWLVLERLRQRRLAHLSPAQRALVEKVIQPVRVDDGRVLYCLREDAELFDGASPEPGPMLLAPLDPVVYDRAVARAVWGFDYTWEVYTPAAKRVRGYYALPLMAGGEIIGHVDPRADRAAGELVATTNVADRAVVLAALRPLAAFLGLEKVRVGRAG